jgi:two-component system, NarL family, sensor histidine kinase UhpB
VALSSVAGGLRLVVRDDGRGLPGGAAAGTGITGMRERALHIGGQLSVSAVDAGGTEVRLDVPFPRGGE